MYKNLPLFTFASLLLLISYSVASAQQATSTTNIHIENKFNLNKTLQDSYLLANSIENAGGISKIDATSSTSINDGNIIINRPNLITFLTAKYGMPTESNANTFYFLDKLYQCNVNKTGNYIFSFDDKKVLCGNELSSIKDKKKIFTMKYNESYSILASDSILIINKNFKDSSSFVGSNESIFTKTNSIYSKSKLEQSYTDNSTSSPHVTDVMDDWTISEGAQGLMMTKNSRTYTMDDGTTRADIYDTNTGMIKVASTTSVKNTIINNTDNSSTTMQANTTNDNRSSSTPTIENDAPADDTSTMGVIKGYFKTFLDVVQFWK